jgi:hypothetical protein
VSPHQRGALIVAGLVLLALLAASTACSGGRSGVGPLEFTWRVGTTEDGIGSLVASGLVSDEGSSYTLHATPAITDGEGYSDLLPGILGAAVNGFGLDHEIDPNGQTDVVVGADGTRYYRLGWLAQEAPEAMAGTTWIKVTPDGEPPKIDIATFLVSERFDEALVDLVQASINGQAITRPTFDLEEDPYTFMFDPWRGVRGREVHFDGDRADGSVRWVADPASQVPTSGEVTWTSATGSPANLPDPVDTIDADDLARALSAARQD